MSRWEPGETVQGLVALHWSLQYYGVPHAGKAVEIIMYRETRSLIAFIAGIFALAAVVGVFAWVTTGFTNWNAKTWFKPDKLVVTPADKDNKNPVVDDKQDPTDDDKEDPSGKEEQKPVEEDKQDPVVDDKTDNTGANEQVPADDDEQNPVGDDEQNVAGDDEQNPVGDDEQNVAGDDEQNPVGDDEQNPVGDDEQNVAGDDEQDPVGDDEQDIAGDVEEDVAGIDVQADTLSERHQSAVHSSAHKAAANSGLVYDSDDVEVIADVVLPLKPVVKRVANAYGFGMDPDEFYPKSVLKLNYAFGTVDGVFGQITTISTSKFTNGYFYIPYTTILNQLSYGHDSNNPNFSTVLLRACFTTTTDLAGETVTLKLGTYYDSTSETRVNAGSWDVTFEGTKLTVTSNVTLSNGVTGAGYQGVSLYPCFFPYEVDFPNMADDYSFMCSHTYLTGLGHSFSIDLTNLSFANTLHDVCTVLVFPVQFGHDDVIVPGYIPPIHFSITQLAAPANVTVTEDKITWDAVEGAEGYSVFFGDSVQTVTETELPISTFDGIQNGENLFRVRALGNVGSALATAAPQRLSAFNASNRISQVVCLTYVIDGDTVNKFVPVNTALEMQLYDVEVDGSVFGGWYYDSGFTEKVNSKDLITKDLTIYARLSEKPASEKKITSWWQNNKWYVLIPCIVFGVLVVIGVVVYFIKRNR